MNTTIWKNPLANQGKKNRDVELEHLTRGTLDASFEELHAAGCIQTGSDRYDNAETALVSCGNVFYALMSLTARNPCNGCPVAYRRIPNKSGPLSIACSAFQKHHTAPQSVRTASQSQIEQATQAGNKNGDQWANVPIRKIAEQLGITLSEARRRKAAGEL